ncbi:MAG TPA: endonuclease [Prevotellaceae bacterium]|jgi:endonuclease/exonuclease/phosphatase family metal-dependent hydrolase|nr:endonuclease [Prevotellaceae bacterium]
MKRIYILLVLCIALSISAFAKKELNIGSYNIRLLTKVDYEHNDGWDQRRNILCDLIRFQNFDAFGAQEVTHPQLEDMLQRLPDYEYEGVGRDDGAQKGEYSPVFYNKTRFKKLGGGTFWLSETPDKVSFGWDAVCRRVCSYVHLKDKETKQEFWFFNAHLDHRGTTARKEAVKLIVAKIAELAGKTDNIVVTGDFNVSQFSEAYETMVGSQKLVDAYTVAKARFAPGGTFNGWDASNFTISRIDHIFVGKGTEVSRYGELTYHYWLGEKISDAEFRAAPTDIKAEKREVHCPSDHYPINAWITFPKKK